MVDKRRIIMAGGTLMCALGIGYFMQKSPAPAPVQKQAAASQASVAPAAAPPTAPQDQAGGAPLEAPETSQTAALTEETLPIEDVQLTSATTEAVSAPLIAPLEPWETEAEIVPAAARADSAAEAMTPETAPAPELACEIAVSAEVKPAAMVALDISAPCLPNERLTLHHNGMMVSQATDAQGALSVTVPALAETAVFIVAFANGEGAVANAAVPELADFDRAVIQWKGNGGLELHALEYGADYFTKGHVWKETANGPSDAARGVGGFLMPLGDTSLDSPLLAEVYTFPTGHALKSGDVSLSVEAEITRDNCATDVEAQSLQVTAGQSPKTQDVVIAMPECEAVGDYLVLKNLLNDLKVASN